MSNVDFFRPASLGQALGFLAQSSDETKTWLMAGGTDLMVAVNSRALSPQRVMDIWDLSELRAVEQDEDSLTLGALTTYTQMIEDQRIRDSAPLLS